MKKIAILTLLLFTLNANAARIIYFGDSHSVATVAPFGITMNKLLRSLPGAEVLTHARCGSIISWWYTGKETTCGFFDQDTGDNSLPVLHRPDRSHKKPYFPTKAPTPKILPEMEDFKPALLVVEMGGNYQHASDPVATAKKDISRFINDISKMKMDCIWISPPNRRTDLNQGMAELVKAIRETVEGRCTFIDSTKLTEFPAHAPDGGPIHGGKDGIHYSFPEGYPVAEKWAKTAFETVKAHYKKL